MFPLSAVVLLSACDPSLTAGSDTPTVDPTPEPITTENTIFDYVGGLSINKVSFNQGIESVMWRNGHEANTEQPNIVAGREALIRVFVEPDSDFDPRRVVATLEVTGGDNEDVFLEKRKRIEAQSVNEDLGSTINFTLTADQLNKPSEIRLEVRESTGDGLGGGTEEDMTFDSARDLPGGLPTQRSDDLTLVILPIAYQADGSGRLPDVGQGHIDEIQAWMYATYPARSVTVRVEEPMSWNGDLGPSSYNGWISLLSAVSDLRDGANEPPNTYYYAMFNPEPTLGQYCSAGCLLGLSNLGYSVNQEWMRSSIGVGYTSFDVAATTLIHEVGHAHGRQHADCGLYGGASDPDFPHPNAEMGAWGYDLVNETLVDPEESYDMMSYCTPPWVSDYTYSALLDRIEILGDQARASDRRVTRLVVTPDGATEVRGTVGIAGPQDGGVAVDVSLSDPSGRAVRSTRGWMFPFSHIAGGIVTLDEVLPDGWTAQVR